MVEVLRTTPGYINTQIKDRQLLCLPRKVNKNDEKQIPNKYCHYLEDRGHNTSEYRDLLKQLWRLYEDGKNEDVRKRHMVRTRLPGLGMKEAEQGHRGMIAQCPHVKPC